MVKFGPVTYDQWLTQGCDYGYEGNKIPCLECGVTFENHRELEPYYVYRFNFETNMTEKCERFCREFKPE